MTNHPSPLHERSPRAKQSTELILLFRSCNVYIHTLCLLGSCGFHTLTLILIFGKLIDVVLQIHVYDWLCVNLYVDIFWEYNTHQLMDWFVPITNVRRISWRQLHRLRLMLEKSISSTKEWLVRGAACPRQCVEHSTLWNFHHWLFLAKVRGVPENDKSLYYTERGAGFEFMNFLFSTIN